MKIKTLFAFGMLAFILVAGCKHISPDPTPVYIRAGHEVHTFFSPCGFMGTYIESQTNANGVYTGHNYCDGGTYTVTYDSNESQFRVSTYAADYMAATTDGGAYSEIAIRPYSPADTLKCYASANGEHIVCENAAGVITYREEHPSVRGIIDADGSETLVFYDEQETPF